MRRGKMVLVFLSIVSLGIGFWLWPVPSGLIKMISISMFALSAALMLYTAVMSAFELNVVQSHQEQIGLGFLGLVGLLFLFGVFRHGQLYWAERSILSFVALVVLLAVGAAAAYWGYQNLMPKSWRWTFAFPALWFFALLFGLVQITKYSTRQGEVRPTAAPAVEIKKQ